MTESNVSVVDSKQHGDLNVDGYSGVSTAQTGYPCRLQPGRELDEKGKLCCGT